MDFTVWIVRVVVNLTGPMRIWFSFKWFFGSGFCV